MKKVLHRKRVASVEEGKQNTAEALKAPESTGSKTVLSSGKKISAGVLHQMERTLKVTEV